MSIVVSPPVEQLKLAGEVAKHVEILRLDLIQCYADMRLYERGVKKPFPKPPLSLEIENKILSHKIKDSMLIADLSFSAKALRSERGKEVANWSLVLRVVYRLDKGFRPKPKALKAFVDINAFFNCWPYWREFCSDMIHRSKLPKLTLPLLHIASLPPAQPPK